ncbi:MAG: aldo/keto reductase family protein [Spirochaetales bacterium]|nr:aldo/keto reductase family protein [Spirochaetales bacterium]
MQYRKLGRTGLVVSEIAYGSWLTFGNQVELDSAKKIIQKAFDLGINYIDTADVYNRGEAENLLGQILPAKRRSEYIVATKGFWPMSEGVNDRGLSRKHIFDTVNASLERLKLNYVDLWYCHRYDTETPLSETLEAIEDLIRQGKILYWGTSEWEADQIAEAWALCEAKGWHKPVVNQPYYSLLGRKIEQRILPTCQRLGMGTASFSPLAQGILTGKYSGGVIPAGSRGADSRLNGFMKDNLTNHRVLERVDHLAGLAQKNGVTVAQIAISALLHTPGLSSVIVGASSVAQLEENAKASGMKLSAQDLKKIDKLFPIS